MNDRELLDAAAKAAGVHLHHWNDALDCYMSSTVEGGDPDYGWNPLTDDGDAFRLAVKLGFEISHDYVLCAHCDVRTRDRKIYSIREFHQGDPCAATRRAITRAAAAIGEQKCRT